jgi:Kef-type K+ transport system membrane component KefB
MPHAPDQLLLQLLAIFVAAKVAGELFETVRLPSVLGEILAGIALGPFALHWINPSDTIHSVAEIGAIFVLFSAGLETSPQDLIRVGRKALLVAVAGVVVPFLLGFAYMKWRGDASSEAIFVGAAMVATSVGITARVLGDLRVLATRTAKIILGAAVFDDILGMVLLAVVAGLASGGGLEWVHLGVLVVEAAAFALFMIFLAPHIVRRIQPGMDRLSTQQAPLIVALALCLFLSWLSAKIGMAAIIGAFFAGLMFADYAPRWNLLPRVGGITEFLAPFFFFTIGSRLNVHLFAGKVLYAAIVISFLAIVSKVVGCGLPLWREGWLSALQVGVGMMPRFDCRAGWIAIADCVAVYVCHCCVHDGCDHDPGTAPVAISVPWRDEHDLGAELAPTSNPGIISVLLVRRIHDSFRPRRAGDGGVARHWTGLRLAIGQVRSYRGAGGARPGKVAGTGG